MKVLLPWGLEERDLRFAELDAALMTGKAIAGPVRKKGPGKERQWRRRWRYLIETGREADAIEEFRSEHEESQASGEHQQDRASHVHCEHQGKRASHLTCGHQGNGASHAER